MIVCYNEFCEIQKWNIMMLRQNCDLPIIWDKRNAILFVLFYF